MGRPPKLTPEVQQRIVDNLRLGNFLKASAEAAGVSAPTLRRWMTDQRPQYRALQADVTMAEAQAEVLTVGQIRLAAPRNPATALRLLERRYPERWGRARAEAVAAPPEELPVTPEVRFVDLGLISLTPEWTYVLMRILVQAQMGRTPAEFFGNPDPLAGLREEDEPRLPWWDSSASEVPENRPRAMLVKPPLALEPGHGVAGPRSAAVTALGRPGQDGQSPQADPSGQPRDRATGEPVGGAPSLAPDDPVQRDREQNRVQSHEGPSGGEGHAAVTPASAPGAAGSSTDVPRFLPEWQGRLKPL